MAYYSEWNSAPTIVMDLMSPIVWSKMVLQADV